MSAPKIIKSGQKLGVLLPGMGAVGTTFMAGVELIRKGLKVPVGSLTQMGTIRLGKRTDNKTPKIKDFIDLASLNLVFGGWDLYKDNAYEAATRAGVLAQADLDLVKEELCRVVPLPGLYNPDYIKNLKPNNIKTLSKKWEQAESIIRDIKNFKEKEKVDSLVMIWCGSTETYLAPSAVHQSLSAFESGLKDNSPEIPPSMIYAYAAIKSGIPYANGAPNLSADIPAMLELADQEKVPIGGKDFKTGQTFMKTILAPGFKARLLGISGWFSTNILGNRDGEVLDNPEAFKTKEESKLSVLDQIVQPELYPELYGNLYHKVRINYYPPRGDNKEGWDNIDIFGWLGYPMQIKVDFLCRDSILAAPLVLDLILFLDLAKRAGLYGIQEWLSFYFKAPVTAPGLYPEHDLFIQQIKLKNTLRWMKGEDVITHLGREYYE